MRKYYMVAFFLFVFLWSTTTSAQEVIQQFDISKKLDGENTRFNLAMNPETGDVLIAWERLHYNEKDKYVVDGIYYAFAKKKSNGKYRIIGPKYLYKCKEIELLPDYYRDENYQYPDVEFDTYNKRFMVVFSSNALNIAKSQIVSDKGKLIGEPKWIWPDTVNTPSMWKDMTMAKIIFIPDSKGLFYIFFRHDNITSSGLSGKAGIFMAMLNSDGTLREGSVNGPVFEHLVGEGTQSGGVKTIDHQIGGSIFTKDGKILMGVGKPVWADTQFGYTFIAYAARVDTNGNVLKTIKLGEENSAGALNITPLSKRLDMFTFNGDWTKEACRGTNVLNSILTYKLKQKGTTRQVIPDAKCLSAWAVKLGKDKGSYQVYKPADYQAIYGRYITKMGKYHDAVKLISTGACFGFIKALTLPGTDTVFVVWLNSNDNEALAENEIKGFTFQAK